MAVQSGARREWRAGQRDRRYSGRLHARRLGVSAPRARDRPCRAALRRLYQG
jgi:hypothetical protein